MRAYAGHHGDGEEHGKHRRATVAEKRQREADDRYNAHAHTDIQKGLESQHRRNPDGQKIGKAVMPHLGRYRKADGNDNL